MQYNKYYSLTESEVNIQYIKAEAKTLTTQAKLTEHLSRHRNKRI